MAFRSAPRRAVAALVLALAIASPLAASAQVDPYKQHMEKGVKLYRERNWPGALAEFRAAYEVRPNANPLVNIALCDKEMFRYPAAIQALKDAIAKHGDAMDAADRKAAEDAIKEMEGLLGTVTLAVTPRGATVLVDGEELRDGAAELPIRLGSGVHKIVVRAEGYKADERSVLIASGEDQKIAVALTAEASAVVVPPPPPDPPKKDAPPPTRGVYLLGVGALLFPTTHASGWPNFKTDYGAAYGVRLGFQVNEVAGFDATYEHSSIDTLTTDDANAYYRIVANRLAFGLRLNSPGRRVRFVGGFAVGGVLDSIVFVIPAGSMVTSMCPKNAQMTFSPSSNCPFNSGSGLDAFALAEAGIEIDIDRVLIDLSAEGEFQSTGGLQTDQNNGQTFSIFGAHPLVNIGPAIRFGYRFW